MLFKGHSLHNARSAGTSEKATQKVNEKLLLWADAVFVMERRHKELLKQRFPSIIAQKYVVLLDIIDKYQFGDEELVKILKEKLDEYL